MLAKRDFHLQTGNLGYKTGLSFTNGESWVTNGILGLLFTQVTDKYHIPLIINDRIDIAMAVQAAGVHIGQHDLPAAAVRKVIGENMLLGVSASSIVEAIQAQQDGADYL